MDARVLRDHEGGARSFTDLIATTRRAAAALEEIAQNALQTLIREEPAALEVATGLYERLFVP